MEGWGDCEDKAFLTPTLFRTFGYNPVLLKYSTLVAVGLQCLDCPGSLRVGGRQYAYVESTARGWKIKKDASAIPIGSTDDAVSAPVVVYRRGMHDLVASI